MNQYSLLIFQRRNGQRFSNTVLTNTKYRLNNMSNFPFQITFYPILAKFLRQQYKLSVLLERIMDLLVANESALSTTYKKGCNWKDMLQFKTKAKIYANYLAKNIFYLYKDLILLTITNNVLQFCERTSLLFECMRYCQIF